VKEVDADLAESVSCNEFGRSVVGRETFPEELSDSGLLGALAKRCGQDVAKAAPTGASAQGCGHPTTVVSGRRPSVLLRIAIEPSDAPNTLRVCGPTNASR